jgi:hypothetical protein
MRSLRLRKHKKNTKLLMADQNPKQGKTPLTCRLILLYIIIAV